MSKCRTCKRSEDNGMTCDITDCCSNGRYIHYSPNAAEQARLAARKSDANDAQMARAKARKEDKQ